jgi:hypothetical protein
MGKASSFEGRDAIFHQEVSADLPFVQGLCAQCMGNVRNMVPIPSVFLRDDITSYNIS